MRNYLYYEIKPFIPRATRLRIRRWFALRMRDSVQDTWPIAPGSQLSPKGWPGWPNGKRFAFVLTHDVEGREGLARCRRLMQLEMELGFRSSFNFVPEGEYRVPFELRQELVSNGFEIGVHDLHHDGKLYSTRNGFLRKSKRINYYLKEWGASGFRGAFMFHNLTWLHDLNIQYDCSTFDTDPFEPQPDGVGTIFPFWVPRAEGGYAELPYTLTQDSNLFFLLNEKTTQIWENKLEWIAEHGGMALLNTHPDYIHFQGSQCVGEYPEHLYASFLRKVRTKYGDQFWNALPKEVGRFVNSHREVLRLDSPFPKQPGSHTKPVGYKKIWIDLENTPHIPFFKPICRELERRGYIVVLTARDAFQTCDMATAYGFKYKRIGRHYGKNRLLKIFGLLFRSLQLFPFVLREKPVLGLNHGARAQTFVCNLLRIPTVMVMDYEHTQVLPLVKPTWEILPDVVTSDGSEASKRRILKYAGIKEDVYVPEFEPDDSIIKQLGLNGEIIVTVRPPATEAHYHNPQSEILFEILMDRICKSEGVKAVLLPRNGTQKNELITKHPEWFRASKTVIPEGVVNGLNLLWHSDLAVSGGGTMNREAAALGVPVYSIFQGKQGAVDLKLQQEGRLILINSSEEVCSKIEFLKRDKSSPPNTTPKQALQDITGYIEYIIRMEDRSR